MTIKSSGLISLSDINVELGRAANAPISLNDPAVRTLLAVSAGAIGLANAYGKSNYAPPGSVPFIAPGTYNFTVPNFANSLTVKLWGGGAAPLYSWLNSSPTGTTAAGTASSFGSYLSATGSETRQAINPNDGTLLYDNSTNPPTPLYDNFPGNGYGGDINESGQYVIQTYNTVTAGAAGGLAYGGGNSITNTLVLGNIYPGQNGNPFGGGGFPFIDNTQALKFVYNDGGSGAGFSMKTFNRTSLLQNTVVTLTVGKGGIGTTYTNGKHGNGADGAVLISWT